MKKIVDSGILNYTVEQNGDDVIVYREKEVVEVKIQGVYTTFTTYQFFATYENTTVEIVEGIIKGIGKKYLS